MMKVKLNVNCSIIDLSKCFVIITVGAVWRYGWRNEKAKIKAKAV